MNPLEIAVASVHDLPALVELDRACFGAAAWSTPMWRAELVRSYARVDIIYDVSAATRQIAQERPLVAAIATWFFEGELHILRVSTAPQARRRGLAEQLLRGAIVRAIQAQGERALLEVASLNLGAVALYEKLGFRVVGRRKSYYRAPVDDALAMTLALEEYQGAT